MPEHIRQEPKVLVSTENLTEQEWLAYRRRGIGGSDVAAILGISPFRTARDLYDDKLNIASVADDAGNWVALEMGLRDALYLLENSGLKVGVSCAIAAYSAATCSSHSNVSSIGFCS